MRKKFVMELDDKLEKMVDEYFINPFLFKNKSKENVKMRKKI